MLNRVEMAGSGVSSRLAVKAQGQGRPLTLIHGWGMNSAVFTPLVDELQSDFRCQLVDLPGHGRSPWQQDLGFEQQVELLARNIDDSSLLGWSMGGLYAIELARRYPERFDRVILVASNPRFVVAEDWRSAVEREVFDVFAESLSADWHATIRRFVGLQLHGLDDARSLIRQLSDLLLQGGAPTRAGLHHGLRLLLQHDARATLRQLGQPLLMILGKRDMLVPSGLEQQIHRVNPAIRVECFARSAHVPFVTHPNLVADLLREFTQSTTPR